jgi:hypothetical protein
MEILIVVHTRFQIIYLYFTFPRVLKRHVYIDKPALIYATSQRNLSMGLFDATFKSR